MEGVMDVAAKDKVHPCCFALPQEKDAFFNLDLSGCVDAFNDTFMK